ncbi:hypothetical protein [Pseudomonas sp. CCC2.2]|uniref:hypothetical protein n=1 Tax=Pseudomonas sp. CCC2.2 TaxID=3048605 RepID=UPI002B226268|nr:hypothetical protein [Pseudomonas sp. CCC2.2]MEB0148556.1 hypothetical protein [Pseudomonas sp. CCC2.2]
MRAVVEKGPAASRHHLEACKTPTLPEFLQAVIAIGLQVLMDATDQFGKIAKFPDDHFNSVFAAMNQKWSSVLDKRVER